MAAFGKFIAAIAASCMTSAALAQDTSDLQTFLLTYQCAIIERLKIVHATVAPKDRFFIFSLKSDKQAYVQCLFLPDQPRMLCEAASGYYARDGWRVPQDRLAHLARLGFSLDDSQGNYQRMIELGGGVDFIAIADLILEAIFHGYGARLGTPMEWNAPLVPKNDDSNERCTPIG